jgi:protein kinase A
MASSLIRGAKNELYQFISYSNAIDDTELIDNFKQRWSRVSPCDVAISLDKFQLIRTLGRGSFGRVVLALFKNENMIKNDGNKFYAIKVMDKRKLVRYKQIDHTLNERRVLFSLQHPNTVRYYFSFKDNSFIYLSLEYISGGDLFTYLRHTGKFNEKHVKFYAAQIFLVFEYLHHFDVLYVI